MFRKKRFLSLTTKLLIITAAAIAVSLLVFFACQEVGNFLVWRYYLADDAKQERMIAYLDDLNEFAYKNKLSVDDTQAFAKWSAGKYVYVVLYKDSNLIYAPEWFEDFQTGEESTAEFDPDETEIEVDIQETESRAAEYDFSSGNWFSGDRGFEQYLTEEAREEYRAALESILKGNAELAPVYCIDGTLLANVVDHSEDFMYNLVFATSFVCAFLVIGIIMLLNLTRLTARVTSLADNVRQVENKDINKTIQISGNDEIASLAKDIDSMRNSVIDNMTKGRQAWEANASLITAMSHDIRTPLTVLLGYLDLMEFQEENAVNREYIGVCKENALRLKKLSDDMFSYFLVFGKSDVTLDIVSCDACDTVGYMIAEHEILLSEKGYTLEKDGDIPHIDIKADTVCLGRVFDNIFTNISKYADEAFPVLIKVTLEDEYLSVEFKNKIRSVGESAESNRIGIKTCMRIMEQMGGGLTSLDDGNEYSTIIKIPLATVEKEK